jgi:phage terminase large subunit-like protein
MRGVIKREWFEVIDEPPARLSIARYWDTAFQKKKTSDFIVGVKYGVARDGLRYILHRIMLSGAMVVK